MAIGNWLRGVHSLGTLTHASGRVTAETGNHNELEAQRHEATHRLGLHAEPGAKQNSSLRRNPGFSIQHSTQMQPFKREMDRLHFIDGHAEPGDPQPLHPDQVGLDPSRLTLPRHVAIDTVFPPRYSNDQADAQVRRGGYRTPCLKRMATAFERVSADRREYR